MLPIPSMSPNECIASEFAHLRLCIVYAKTCLTTSSLSWFAIASNQHRAKLQAIAPPADFMRPWIGVQTVIVV